MANSHWIERRLQPTDSPLATAAVTLAAIVLALLLGGLLMLPFTPHPGQAYWAIVENAFGSLRGLGFTLVKATPLILIALGTIVAWRTSFFYLGFEGTLLLGAAATVWVALRAAPQEGLTGLPGWIFFPLVIGAAFAAGGLWAGAVGFLRSRFGGNEVLISLMTNYVAILLVNYLVSGPLRAPGDLPQTERIPETALLPFFIPDTRAHAGFLLALLAALLVWLFLRRTPLGYELIATGFSERAARYGGIPTGQRLVLAAFLGGGLGALAGLVEVLGVQFRLMDGIAQGTGFVGVVVALLGKLNPLGSVVAAILYAGMGVGSEVLQRRAGLPSSVIFIVQSLIVLLILAGDLLRYYRFTWPFRTGRLTATAGPRE